MVHPLHAEALARIQDGSLYPKRLRPVARPEGELLFHIHVDAQEALPPAVRKALIGAGFVADNFDHDFRTFGKDGDPSLAFDHFEPENHFTYKTGDPTNYYATWLAAARAVRTASKRVYLEGELIPLDHELGAHPFDEAAYERLAGPTEYDALSFVSAIDGKRRRLPLRVETRQLTEVNSSAPTEIFRLGEIHLTLRDDADRRLIELLNNIGLYAPAIPKVLVSDEGGLLLNPQGEPLLIRDIPFTIQAVDTVALLRFTDALLRVVQATGGYTDASIKVELALDFDLVNGVDPRTGLPPVIKSVEYGPEFAGLPTRREVAGIPIPPLPAGLAAQLREARRATSAQRVTGSKQVEVRRSIL